MNADPKRFSRIICPQSVRPRPDRSKPRPPAAIRRWLRASGWQWAALLLICVSSCEGPRPAPIVTLSELRRGAPLPLTRRDALVIADVQALGTAYRPLGPRLGVIEIRDDATWEALQRGQARPLANRTPPDFDAGFVVGLVSTVGTPMGSDWPIRLDTVREANGGLLLQGAFTSGTYLPDGVTYADIAYVRGGRTVLAADVSGLNYAVRADENAGD